MNPSFAEIFPEVITCYNNPDKEMNSKLVELLQKEVVRPHREGNPLQTKDCHLEKRDEYSCFFSWVNQCLENYKDTLELDTEALRVSLAWGNIYFKDNAIPRHYHPNAYLSAVYYVSEQCSPTMFFRDDYNKNIYVSSNRRDIWKCPSNAGSLILFPSYMRHQSMPASTKRITISFNVLPSGDTSTKINGFIDATF